MPGPRALASTSLQSRVRSPRRERSQRYPQLSADYDRFEREASRFEAQIDQLERLQTQKVPRGDPRYRTIAQQIGSQTTQIEAFSREFDTPDRTSTSRVSPVSAGVFRSERQRVSPVWYLTPLAATLAAQLW